MAYCERRVIGSNRPNADQYALVDAPEKVSHYQGLFAANEQRFTCARRAGALSTRGCREFWTMKKRILPLRAAMLPSTLCAYVSVTYGRGGDDIRLDPELESQLRPHFCRSERTRA